MIRGRGELCVWWVRSHIYWFPIIQNGLLVEMTSYNILRCVKTTNQFVDS
jgi:hypothetical protein